MRTHTSILIQIATLLLAMTGGTSLQAAITFAAAPLSNTTPLGMRAI